MATFIEVFNSSGDTVLLNLDSVRVIESYYDEYEEIEGLKEGIYVCWNYNDDSDGIDRQGDFTVFYGINYEELAEFLGIKRLEPDAPPC